MERYEYSVPYQPLGLPSPAYLANYDRIFSKNKDLGEDPGSGGGSTPPVGTSAPPADAVTPRLGPGPLEKGLTGDANDRPCAREVRRTEFRERVARRLAALKVPVIVDSSMPPGTAELRGPAGAIRLVNLGEGGPPPPDPHDPLSPLPLPPPAAPGGPMRRLTLALLAVLALASTACTPRWTPAFRADMARGFTVQFLILGAEPEQATRLGVCMATEVEKGVSQRELEDAHAAGAVTPRIRAAGEAAFRYCVCEVVKPPAAFKPGMVCGPPADPAPPAGTTEGAI